MRQWSNAVCGDTLTDNANIPFICMAIQEPITITRQCRRLYTHRHRIQYMVRTRTVPPRSLLQREYTQSEATENFYGLTSACELSVS